MRQPIPFGKYLLLERISVGGMAEVFKAKSFGVEGFEKILAIKRILPSMSEDQEFIEMFIDEAKIAGQLSHANICQIFELGRIGDSHFIAMEYVWGKDLLQIQNRFRRMKQTMAPAMAAFVATRICEGLDYAHRKKDAQGKPLGIIHRDVSPQNVLVSYEGEIKMIDFGIAKAVGRSSKTQAGVLKGKFGYMSPEQVRGLPIDRRSDVFAIGTILHELMTGERLFVAESDFATLEKVRNVDVLPPRAINPKVPDPLDRIVMRALAKNPDDRFQWANELQEELQAFLMVQEPVFTAKQLSQFMKETFAAELRREQLMLETYKRVGRDGRLPEAPPVAGPAPPQRAPTPPPPLSAALRDTLPLSTPSPLASPHAAAQRPVTSGFTPPGGRTASPPPKSSTTQPLSLPDGGAVAVDPSQFDEPTTIDQPNFKTYEGEADEPTVSESAQEAVAAAVAAFEEEAPTDIYDDKAPAQAAPPKLDPMLSSQPTVILASGSGSRPVPTQASASGSVIVESTPSKQALPLPSPSGRGPAVARTQALGRRGGWAVWKDIGIGVAVAATVLLAVIGVRTALRMRESGPAHATLVVAVTTPRDAYVRVRGNGGEWQGRLAPGVPAATFKDLAPAPYDVEVTAEGVPPFRKRVELRPGDAEVLMASFAESATASLKLKVMPGRASVWLDGVEMTSGDEPITVPVGKHEVRVAHEGFDEQRFSIEARPGEQIERSLELKRAQGVIDVTSDPEGGDVIIDGHYRGRTPVTLEGLEIGKSYQVKVRHSGFESAHKTITLSSRTPHERVEVTLLERVERTGKERVAASDHEPRGSDGRAASPAPKEEAAAPSKKETHAAPASASAERSESDKEKTERPGPSAGESGFLIANTQPWARVVIDGKDTGKTTPIAPLGKIALKPGKHVVRFVVGGKWFDYEIMVKAGEDTRLIRKLDVGP